MVIFVDHIAGGPPSSSTWCMLNVSCASQQVATRLLSCYNSQHRANRICVWLLLGLDIGRKRRLILSWGSWSWSCSNTQLMPVGFFRQRCRFMPTLACQPGNVRPQRLVQKARVSINDSKSQFLTCQKKKKRKEKSKAHHVSHPARV